MAKKAKSPEQPQHKTIQDNLVNDIIRGVYEKGSMIPNQEELSLRYHVSRTTVRKATDELIRNGILRAVKGKGTFVCRFGENTHQIFNSTACEEAHIIRSSMTSRTVKIAPLPASEAIAKQLGVQEGAGTLYLERVRLLCGHPYAVQLSHLNESDVSSVALTKERLDTGSLFQILEEEAKLIPAYQDEELRAIACPARIAGYLELEPLQPVILIFRTVYTSSGHVMEYCEDYERTDLKGVRIRSIARPEYKEETP